MSDANDYYKLHEQAVKKAKSRNISTTGKGGYSHHLLFCSGENCCAGQNNEGVFKHLVKRSQELNKRGIYVYRTKVECLNLCRSGPLLIVYPEGIWYHSVTEKIIDRIIDDHLLGGKVVEEYAFADNPMQ